MHVLSYCLLLTFLSTDLKKNPLCTRKNSVAAIGSKITTITLNFFLFELTIVVRMLFLIMASELVCFFYRCLLEYKNVLVSALGGFHIYTHLFEWNDISFIYLNFLVHYANTFEFGSLVYQHGVQFIFEWAWLSLILFLPLWKLIKIVK